METNNKLREALKKILDLTNSLDEDCAVDPVEIRDIAKAALATPIRNYEIGTAHEQSNRMDDYCARHGEFIGGSWRCDKCPLCSINRCELVWAQMPYRKGVSNAK